MEDLRNNYRAQTLQLLGNFQLLEFALKVYISRCFKFIRIRVGGEIQFDYSEKDVEELPLGRLIKLFSKFSTDFELLTRLRKLQSERNEIAHRSLLIATGPSYDRGAIEDKYIENLQLEGELTTCLRAVILANRDLSSEDVK